ncbi:Metallophosphoesterase domain-containing protein [Lachnellula subtilissima]|uniref:Metallophosphoesterase domain-containing protein n=1 Tax=Lachnellula subtilissima TaxID=602034 RepID=A0A8H8UET6_9HELO|nr:Metallophosphoesterase domain-containing protein [Lachnellula subtilissima]
MNAIALRTLDEEDQDGEKEDHEKAMHLTGKLAEAAAVTYLTEGVHNFTLNSGAKFTVYASPYQPRFGVWAFPYERNEDRFNPVGHAAPGTVSISRNPVPDSPDVDIMMTHEPPMGLLDGSSHGHLGCTGLLHALQRCRPRMHCFGHVHEGYGRNWYLGKKMTRLMRWRLCTKRRLIKSTVILGRSVARSASGKKHCWLMRRLWMGEASLRMIRGWLILTCNEFDRGRQQYGHSALSSIIY